jgi:hypothetical protein
MSDASKSDPAVPVTTTPAEPAVVAEPTPVTAAGVSEAEVTPVAEPVTPVVAAAVPVERKKRGIGAWSFVLGLLTGLIDIAFVVILAVTVASFIGGLTGGDFSDLGISTAIGGAGLVLAALFLFFGGFLTAGLGALLGLVALVSGRGRVLGLFGLLFSAGAIIVRVLLLSTGNFVPGLSD